MKVERARMIVRGAVQGVGFRPFVYRLATSLGLRGWVLNSSQGVFIEAEGDHALLQQFRNRLAAEKPPLACLHSLECSILDPVGYEGFEIRYSDESGPKTTVILPDIATCEDCRRELFDPSDRRFRYPFTNCTNCGPRFTIIEALPYDRPNTSMKAFTMCALCEAEYHDPQNRRFHAQPNACPQCGPQLELWKADGSPVANQQTALLAAAQAIRGGRIVALKGIGGFQLLADARNADAVRHLRIRKHREEKPFAVMFPALAAVAVACEFSEAEARLLESPESPIVVLKRNIGIVDEAVAPRNPNLGVMLPYSPLHHLLMRELGFPIVATSGNRSDEPICIDEHEALIRLEGIADLFLVHNRPIVRHVDDSVARLVLDRQQLLRRARGYAPLPIHLKESLPCVLATGPHLKNTVALSVEHDVFISQHIGDLETKEAFNAFRKVTADLQRLYEAEPELVAYDLHPEYLSTKYAQELHHALVPVQHHYAHVLACMAENELDAPVLGVAWDGTGFGFDGTIWGGEFLLVDDTSFERAAHLREFRLPGGDASIKQPRRSALGLLYEIFGEAVFERDDLHCSANELALIRQMLNRGVNTPITTSAGRLFDAVASILDLRQQVHFEGQAAMELEFAIQQGVAEIYPFELDDIIDWEPMILEILKRAEPLGVIAAKFHNTLAEMILQTAQKCQQERVVLSGGCFQNIYLLTRTVQRLRKEGFRPHWHQRIPANDGGIALGQVMAAVRTHRLQPKQEAAYSS